jgi:hypothetical protein
MTRVYLVALVAMALLTQSAPPRAEAGSKYNACGLLTAPDLKAVVNANVDHADDRDVVIPNGPRKGETMSTCTWVLGATYVTLNVIRVPQTAEQRASGLSGLRTLEVGLVKKGWPVEPGEIPGADCSAYKPPPSEGNARPFTSCVMQAKGVGFWLGVHSPANLTPQQVKGLADQVAARLP